MTHLPHVTHLLHDYLDGDLPADVRHAVEHHLAHCSTCRREAEALRSLVADVAALPAAVEPPRDLWAGIAARLDAPPAPARLDRAPASSSASSRRRPSRRALAAAAALVLVAGAAVVWFAGRTAAPAWEVVALYGRPRVAAEDLDGAGRLREGEWLETDAVSRAQLDVGLIGNLEVGPNTRLQLRRAKVDDHRIALAEGRIEALVWAPPRLFFVETPSAVAVDLGCAYTLTVDSTGASLLHVTAGYVELTAPDRSTLVPMGAMCVSRPGRGPGTAFDRDASEALRSALDRYDFDGGGEPALDEVLAEARATDGVTLWQLFMRAAGDTRTRIYDRLAALVAAPSGVTREGVLRGDEAMHAAWSRHLGLDAAGWWSGLR